MKCNCKHLEARAIELFGELEKAKAQIIADDSEILELQDHRGSLLQEVEKWKRGFEKMAESDEQETAERVYWEERAEKAEAELAEVREDRAVKTKALIQLFLCSSQNDLET